jgi:hypothetical protein
MSTKLNTNNMVCSCGGVSTSHHPLGENGCFRYHVTDSNELPTNRRLAEGVGGEVSTWVWDIGGHTITEYTLLYQRNYSQHDNGEWSRPKTKDSTNSLEGDW